MNKVIIDKKFLELKLPISAGLIQGLKKLSLRGFEIIVNDFDLTSNPTLNQLFTLENIKINNGGEAGENSFLISTEKKSQKNTILVKEKTTVDNFEKAVNII